MYILTILLMLFILITVVILTIALVALILIPTKALFTFNLKEHSEYNLTIEWIKPIFRLTIGNNSSIPFLSVYLFNTRIISKTLTKDMKKLPDILRLLKSLNPKYLKIDAAYGFIDPSLTGMICGVIALISQSAKLSELNNTPNFGSDYDYATINAIGTFDSLSTLFRMLDYRKKSLLSPTIQGVK